MNFSVVIPALNEADGIGATIASVREAAAGRAVEVLVVDGGSRDATPRIALESGATVIVASGGRGAQMSAGALRATGEVVVFLHADTWLPADAFGAIEKAMRGPGVVGGGFRKTFRDGPSVVVRGGRRRSEWFFKLTGNVLGDQAMFVARDALEKVGGVPVQPLLEDVVLCERLRKLGKLELLDAEVSTSGRRFEKRGAWRTWVLMGWILAAHWVGVRAETLDRWYRGR